jgi:exopolysaccharide production protein ExoY
MNANASGAPAGVYLRFVKPLIDRVLGLIFALLTLPLLLGLLAASWLTFHRMPLQRVIRIGRRGRRFSLLRVNTRRDDQTDLRGRQLRLSSWLRRTSLDELPQLWNVVLGHMSLVGPRPLDPVEAFELGRRTGARHAVRPGLTGLWQVEARGDGRRLIENQAIDRDYLRRASLRTDVAVLLRTLPALIRNREAV